MSSFGLIIPQKKNLLAEFCQFCDIEYRKIIKYMSVEWLNVAIAVEHLLKQTKHLSPILSQKEKVIKTD